MCIRDSPLPTHTMNNLDVDVMALESDFFSMEISFDSAPIDPQVAADTRRLYDALQDPLVDDVDQMELYKWCLDTVFEWKMGPEEDTSVAELRAFSKQLGREIGEETKRKRKAL
eukprot:3100589-Rhodomonas_salina.1